MSLFITDPVSIKSWFTQYGMVKEMLTIHSNGVVDSPVTMVIPAIKLTVLPIQFGKVDGDYDCSCNRLTSLAGVPYYIAGDLDYGKNRITSLSGIHKHIKHIGGAFYCDAGVTNLLGLMLIAGLQHVTIDAGPIDKIMNKYLLKGRNILMCQNDLIEAGFIEQAKL